MAIPYMPLYIGEFLRDTADLDATETGAYLLLIMHEFTHGSLPKDKAALARITRMSPYFFEKNWKKISKFYSPELTQRRVQLEIERARKLSEKRRASGSLGGRPKSSKSLENNNSEKAIAKQLDNREENQEQSNSKAIGFTPSNHLPNQMAKQNESTRARSIPFHKESRDRGEGFSSPPPPQKSNFEKRCRALVGEEPVLVAMDFYKLQSLVEDAESGVTEADVEAAIAEIMAKPDERLKNWGKVVGWARVAAGRHREQSPKRANGSTNGASHPTERERTYNLGTGADMPERNVLAAIARYRDNPKQPAILWVSWDQFRNELRMNAPELFPLLDAPRTEAGSEPEKKS